MIKNTGFNSERTFGVEIEFFLNRNNTRASDSRMREVARVISSFGVDCEAEGYNHQQRPHWKIVRDVSVAGDGLEIVSPILKGQNGLDQLEKVTKALAEMDAKVNVSCGIHVHHDAGDFTTQTFKNIYTLYNRYETAIDELVAPSRRGTHNQYCKSQTTNYEVLRKAKTVEDIMRIYNDRYVKLNCQSYRRHGTIEFRQHQGSIDFTKISNWVIFTQMIVERSITGNVQMKDGASDWFNFKKAIRGYEWMGADEMQVSAITFLNKRRNELAAA